MKGNPGTGRGDARGEQSSVTPTGQKDHARLKTELAERNTDMEAATQALDMLDKALKKAGSRLADDPKVAALSKRIADMMGAASRLQAEKESHLLKGLVATYGLKLR